MNKPNSKGSLFLYFLIAILLIFTALILHQAYNLWIRDNVNTAADPSVQRTVILDAGHGGFDGGAVSVTGTVEKALNLDTTITLAAFLKAQGYRVILTRETDTELSHESGGSRKMQDLKGRLSVMEQNPGVPFLSIHMNKFPQKKYSGLQIYYSPGDAASKSLADEMQSAVKEHLQPKNERVTKAATSSIFLLHRATSPAILIECGFLSNEEEARKLEDPAYRTALCLTLSAAYGNWEANRSTP